MEQEQAQVLTMLESGTISPEEAAQLLEALESSYRPRTPLAATARSRSERRKAVPLAEAKTFTTGQIVRMARYGITPETLAEMRAAGLDDLSFDQAIELARHGVEPAYVAEIRRLAGERLSFRQIVRLAMHGIDPADVEELLEQELGDSDFDTLVKLARHGIDPQYIRSMRELGIDFSVGELLKMGRHGVTPEQVRRLRAEGLHDLGVRDVIKLAAEGVDPEFVRRVRSYAGDAAAAPSADETADVPPGASADHDPEGDPADDRG